MNRTGSKYCIACAGDFEIEHELLFTFREWQEWKDRKPPMTFSTAELEEMYFQVPWIWGTLFRAIIPTNLHALRDGQFSSQQLRLSGVGQIGSWDRQNLATAPLDEVLVQIGPHDDSGVHVSKFYPPLLCRPGALLLLPVAYFIHERCWQLARRMIGSSNLETNLDLFVIPFHHTWEQLRATFGESEAFYRWEILRVGAANCGQFLEEPP